MCGGLRVAPRRRRRVSDLESLGSAPSPLCITSCIRTYSTTTDSMHESFRALHRARIPSACANVIRRPRVASQSSLTNLQTTPTIDPQRSGRPLVPHQSSMSPPRPFSTQNADWGPISVKEQWSRATPKGLVPPRPSSSVLLISPSNEVLLLHRVSHSSSFAAAHVFPGGHLDAYHGEHLPPPPDPRRHEDGDAYRIAAIRETFEESGILLAHPTSSSASGRSADSDGPTQLLQLTDTERDEGRKLVHLSLIHI